MKRRTQKGITLIALIITIIVLLILAGIVLMSLSGENGILTRAVSVAEKWGTVEEYEREERLKLESKILEQEPNSNNEMISYILDDVPIPKGFTYLEGTREKGLVIKNKEDGNEFVWIPADADKLAEENAENYLYKESTLFPESSNLIESIRLYGGYYVARYSAGSDVEITQNGQMEKVYLQPGKYRYVVGTVKQMTDLCKSIYSEENTNALGVISTYQLMGMELPELNWETWIKEDMLSIKELLGSINPETIEWNGNSYSGIANNFISFELREGKPGQVYHGLLHHYKTYESVFTYDLFDENLSFRPVLYIKLPK